MAGRQVGFFVRRAVRSLAGAASIAGALAAPAPAAAFDLTGGVNAGGVLAGTRPRFAVSPHLGISWRTESGFLVALRDALSVLPATDAHGVGAYNHASSAVGYAWTTGRFSIGPALAIYSMPACGSEQCARLSGLSPGLHAQVDYYFLGSLGVSATATVDWLTGSAVLPAGVAATVLVGPSLKWSSQ